GKAYAAQLRAAMAKEAAELAGRGLHPKLALLLVGDDPASRTYVNAKQRACKQIGIVSEVIELPASASALQLVEKITRLNHEEGCHGILVQLPLPAHIDPGDVLYAVDPRKDVDGLHPENLGLLAAGGTGQPVACTPRACLYLLERAGVDPKGKTVAVIGRSRIVGRPLALLLGNADATVTACHSRTADFAAACRAADVVIAAAGSPGLVTGEMVKEGAVVIDVGITRDPDGSLRGDVAFEEAAARAAWITPVPGGVGPLTVAMLMRNAIDLARAQAGHG
ncbi:MAG: bifunctional 5,10-methylenetetrahydrofolate dehydrogenase/5,10-methenyltetrahydrofolate cyclohydrolase, partial [Betaproteobacteria bacterium AqS2]|nr:bifunctional 5,10-methylenetetrahydrofolate dehydrogenase/5,10-methenyltetrahydrofolate cyclohydrolase [Betaproteobacteria bacterium AqS2]